MVSSKKIVGEVLLAAFAFTAMPTPMMAGSPSTAVAAQSAPAVISIAVSKSKADAAEKSHKKSGGKPVLDTNKLETAAATQASKGVSSAASSAVGGGKVGNAVGGAVSLSKLPFGGGGNTDGADFAVEDDVTAALKKGPVVLVYGPITDANSFRDILVKANVSPFPTVLNVDPTASGNKDFKKHFEGKNGKVVVWAAGAAIDKSSVLTPVQASVGGLVDALKPAQPAPATEPAPTK